MSFGNDGPSLSQVKKPGDVEFLRLFFQSKSEEVRPKKCFLSDKVWKFISCFATYVLEVDAGLLHKLATKGTFRSKKHFWNDYFKEKEEVQLINLKISDRS